MPDELLHFVEDAHVGCVAERAFPDDPDPPAGGWEAFRLPLIPFAAHAAGHRFRRRYS